MVDCVKIPTWLLGVISQNVVTSYAKISVIGGREYENSGKSKIDCFLNSVYSFEDTGIFRFELETKSKYAGGYKNAEVCHNLINMHIAKEISMYIKGYYHCHCWSNTDLGAAPVYNNLEGNKIRVDDIVKDLWENHFNRVIGVKNKREVRGIVNTVKNLAVSLNNDKRTAKIKKMKYKYTLYYYRFCLNCVERNLGECYYGLAFSEKFDELLKSHNEAMKRIIKAYELMGYECNNVIKLDEYARDNKSHQTFQLQLIFAILIGLVSLFLTYYFYIKSDESDCKQHQKVVEELEKIVDKMALYGQENTESVESKK